MATTVDRSRFTTEKVDVDHEHDCQAIAANSQGIIGKSSWTFRHPSVRLVFIPVPQGVCSTPGKEKEELSRPADGFKSQRETSSRTFFFYENLNP